MKVVEEGVFDADSFWTEYVTTQTPVVYKGSCKRTLIAIFACRNALIASVEGMMSG